MLAATELDGLRGTTTGLPLRSVILSLWIVLTGSLAAAGLLGISFDGNFLDLQAPHGRF